MTTVKQKSGRPLDRASLIARVKALARDRGARSLSRREFEAATDISYRQVLRHFDSYTALIRACGLTPFKRPSGIPDETLLAAMHQAFTRAGDIIVGQRFNRAYRYGRGSYRSRWRSWTEALRAYRVWLRSHHPNSPLLPALAMRCSEDGGPVAWDGCGGPRLGAPLNLPGLQHAPTSEVGVIFLFGALAPSLGYVVERLGTRFPDCIAKRRLREPRDTWEQVRIEFEFQSRNFLAHKHDARKCDVIICWENDWPDSPLEVLELKREVARLTKPAAT